MLNQRNRNGCRRLRSEIEGWLLMAVRVLLPPQFKQQRRHHGSSHVGPVHLGMAPRAERDHQPEDRPARYPVVDRDRALPSPGSSADTAAVAVPRQDRLTQAPEVCLILPAKRVADRAQTPRQDAGASAGAMEGTLGRFLHFVISSLQLSLDAYSESKSRRIRETQPLSRAARKPQFPWTQRSCRSR